MVEREIKADDEGGRNNGATSIEDSLGKLTALGFETPDNRMLELSNIALAQVLPGAMSCTLDTVFNPNRKVSLRQQFMLDYLRARRSKGGDHMNKLVALAQEEIATIQDESEEEPRNMG